MRSFRDLANALIEPHRRDKILGSGLEARIVFTLSDPILTLFSDEELAELLIVSEVHGERYEFDEENFGSLTVTRTTHHKCGRCWRHLPEVTEDGSLCSRCDNVVAGMAAAA